MQCMSTIFEKIIAREIPAEIIYEDDRVIAFLDIKPVHAGHLLVVPKQVFTNILDGDGDVLAHMMRVGAELGRKQVAVLGAAGVNLIMNNGAAAGQEVFHAHLHVIPRYEDDNSFVKPQHDEVTSEELGKIADRLRA